MAEGAHLLLKGRDVGPGAGFDVVHVGVDVLRCPLQDEQGRLACEDEARDVVVRGPIDLPVCASCSSAERGASKVHKSKAETHHVVPLLAGAQADQHEPDAPFLLHNLVLLLLLLFHR